MKHNCVVLPLTTALSPGALEPPLCVKKEGGERKKRTCVGLAHFSDSGKATHLEVVNIKKEGG